MTLSIPLPVVRNMVGQSETSAGEHIAVLASGGLDSAVLIGDLARTWRSVQPMYVRFGLVWEKSEEAGLRRYLAALDSSRVLPLKVFECPIRDVYGDHWSTTGVETPDTKSDDSAVFLPGRNLLLLSQSAVWCHLRGIRTIAMGVLSGNPFMDATDEYFTAIERGINLALSGGLRIERPFRGLTKVEVLKRGTGLPLGETISCILPADGKHCGRCNKCEERRKGFLMAGMIDTAEYATDEPLK